ncbi:MAG TPA: S8 family serine peptidase [bacterium]|nr:S8 family serine peptidase [bacterium]
MRTRVRTGGLAAGVAGIVTATMLGGVARANRPNDFVAQQLSFHQIRAVEAWNYVVGSAGVIVAVLDSGVAIDHPDLAPNIWTNPGETASNGVDDDGDGFVDDVHGWNFRDDTNDVYDHLGRGTHVAGVVGAIGNNAQGVAGVCWHCTILPIKVMRDDMEDPGVKASIAAKAIRYAADRGAKVIDCSFITGENDPDLLAAVQYAVGKGAVVVASAGDRSSNLDDHPVYPAAWNLPGLLSVADVDQGAKLALSSDFGPKTVTLVAPGVNVFSTLPGGFVGRMTGSPQAAAHVAGAAALLFSMDPTLTGVEVANRIATLSSNRGILKGKVKTEAILDLGLLVAQKRQTVDAHIIAPTRVKAGEIATFDGSTSEGPIVEWLWKFGDPADEFGKVVPHKWDRPGTVGVELQVRTADGRTASIDQEITIEQKPWIPGLCEVGRPADAGANRGVLGLLLPLFGLLWALRRRR